MHDEPRRVGSDGVTIALRRRLPTACEPVLLIHGLGSDSMATWRASGWLHALESAGFGWIAPDLRGHGASDRPHEAASYRPGLLAGDMMAVLDDAGVDDVGVVGYSLGSRVAVELAVAEPRSVSRLVLGGFGDPPGTAAGAGIERLIESLPPSADIEAVRACAEASLDGCTPAPLERLRAPVLLVAGELDAVAGDVKAAAARCQRARVQRLAGRTHLNALSSPAFKRAAIEFLEES